MLYRVKTLSEILFLHKLLFLCCLKLIAFLWNSTKVDDDVDCTNSDHSSNHFESGSERRMTLRRKCNLITSSKPSKTSKNDNGTCKFIGSLKT